MNSSQFREFLREYYSLNEADAPLGQQEVDEGETSLDAQVDRLLMGYEKEAASVKQESRDYRSLIRRLLTEEGEDAAGGTPPPPADAPPPDKAPAEALDVMSFAESVVRLIDNYDSLLDIRDTIIRRAQKYLDDKYQQQAVIDFKSVMRDSFDVEVGVTDLDKQEKYLPPSAARAGKGTE